LIVDWNKNDFEFERNNRNKISPYLDILFSDTAELNIPPSFYWYRERTLR
jgi:hypothetical protein